MSGMGLAKTMAAVRFVCTAIGLAVAGFFICAGLLGAVIYLILK